jgi:predicted TIM-barrel fold metal-dependent hydrolase
VARRHPELRQIMAHMGHPWQRETITVVRKNPNVFTDISGIWARPFDGFSALVRAQEWGVVDKLLFGSDYPLWRPADAIAELRKLAEIRAGDLPHVKAETIDRILAQDALGLLGLRP